MKISDFLSSLLQIPVLYLVLFLKIFIMKNLKRCKSKDNNNKWAQYTHHYFNNHSLQIVFHLYLHAPLSPHEIISNKIPDIILSWSTFIHKFYTKKTSKMFSLIASNIQSQVSLPLDYLIICIYFYSLFESGSN